MAEEVLNLQLVSVQVDETDEVWGEQNPLLIEDKLAIRLVCLFVNCSGLI
ncbi:hypothetical protein [Streptococcus pneumoniae]|nr:hypothetical protein [Streptococcus pneumoniae]CVY58874.1 Uncharacterised protein [Streptococcus pneumoniae]